MSTRRYGRLFALFTLYRLELEPDFALESWFHELTCEMDDPDSLYYIPKGEKKKVLDFVQDLCLGVSGNQETLDEGLAGLCRNWSWDRVFVLDKIALRIAAYELRFQHETPPKVAISEGVELAKTFGMESTPAFVNGILNQYWKQYSGRASEN